jgi:hypothetical protein
MAIAYPFALGAEAFSTAYCDVRHSVNAAGCDETRLKDFGYSALEGVAQTGRLR